MLFFSLRVNEFTSLLVDSSQVMLLISIRSHKNKCHAKNNTCPQTDKKTCQSVIMPLVLSCWGRAVGVEWESAFIPFSSCDSPWT